MFSCAVSTYAFYIYKGYISILFLQIKLVFSVQNEMFALMVAGVPVISFSWRAYAQRFWPSGNILSRGITWQNQDVFVCAVNYHILTNSLVYNIN